MKAEWRKWRGGRAARGDWRHVVTILLTILALVWDTANVTTVVSCHPPHLHKLAQSWSTGRQGTILVPLAVSSSKSSILNFV